ncbi:CMGC family protein kinase [Tritrichomonas foetus]|uniref:dual-specificity kinase n=1 Tax=Tritrichomonas foetus TaxID=1144522 RepID=A0A1J4JRX6_9EUKA|nr:CMGC family protein kinase [Tritrichomonas foetus]|eukprot:OHT00278.1 CMGC family protein kinase [Tritrichomonas foetus]
MNPAFPVPLRSPRVFHFRPAPPDDAPLTHRPKITDVKINKKSQFPIRPPDSNPNNQSINTSNNLPNKITINLSSNNLTNNMANVPNTQINKATSNNVVNNLTINTITNINDLPKKRPPPKTARAINPRFKKKGGLPNSKPIIFKDPITSNEAIQNYSGQLTPFELTEIKGYDLVYYLGNISKKIKNSHMSKAPNNGFDDTNHHYRAIPGDHLLYRYEIKAIFGKGAFGQVLRVFDHKLKIEVALKVIINTRQMHEQGLIETNILNTLNDGSDPLHNNYIVKVTETFTFRNHICATFEILGQNLYEYSRSMHYKPLPIPQLKSIAQQMFTALKFIHETKRIIHCDMKPENVLLMKNNKNCIRVIDFGSSCHIGRQKYEYIQSRFYRAPEVILGIKYGPPMDIWSVGCIICEMEAGRPIFPGDDESEQMKLFFEVLGLPPKYLLFQGSRRKDFFHEDGTPIVYSKNKKLNISTKSLKSASKISDPLLLDLLQKCFEWDQTKRITAEQALKHPWFNVKEGSTARPQHSLPGLTKK